MNNYTIELLNKNESITKINIQNQNIEGILDLKNFKLLEKLKIYQKH